MDYEFIGDKNDVNPGAEQSETYEDTAYLDDTGYIDDTEAPEDTGHEDPIDEEGDDIPDYPFSNVIDACTGLDVSGCPVELSSGTQVAECVEKVNHEVSWLISEIEYAAKDASGDSSITIEDIRNGEVPATVTAEYHVDENYEHGWLLISFGDNVEMHERDLWMPYETTSVRTVRCYAQNDVLEDGSVKEHLIQNFVKPANENTSSASLSIADYEDYSNAVSVYGDSYDISDSSLYVEPAYYELQDEIDNVLNAAHDLTSGGIWNGVYYYN